MKTLAEYVKAQKLSVRNAMLASPIFAHHLNTPEEKDNERLLALLQKAPAETQCYKSDSSEFQPGFQELAVFWRLALLNDIFKAPYIHLVQETGKSKREIVSGLDYTFGPAIEIHDTARKTFVTAATVIEALGLDLAVEAPEVAEIIKVSAIHGESPGSVDVSIRNHGMVRVALDWEHVDIETNTLTDAATAHIESEVMRKGGFDNVEWNTQA